MGSVEVRVMRVEGRVELGWVLYSSYLYVAVTSWVIQNDVDIETVTISNLRTQGHKDSVTAAESVKDRLQVVERRAAGLGYIISATSIEECYGNVNMIQYVKCVQITISRAVGIEHIVAV